jgi:hypothetical protein
MQSIHISAPQFLPEEAALLQALLRESSRLLLINKPGCTYRQMRKLLRQLSPNTYRRILIAQHHSLAPELGLRGIHFSDENPYTPDDFGPLSLSMSVYGFEEVLRWGDEMNYLWVQLSSDYPQVEIEAFQQKYRGKAQLFVTSALAGTPTYPTIR